MSKTIIAWTFKLATVQKSQVNRAELQEVKLTFMNFLETNGKRGKYIYLPPY